MAMNQAYLAALAGATYVSIFSGRVRDMGYDVRPVIDGDARTSSTARACTSKIIVGSMRHMMDVNEALECGAHVPTITPPILRKMVWNPRTDRDDQRVQHRVARPRQEEVARERHGHELDGQARSRHRRRRLHREPRRRTRARARRARDDRSTISRPACASSSRTARAREARRGGPARCSDRDRRSDARRGLRVPHGGERRHQGQLHRAAQVHRPEHRGDAERARGDAQGRHKQDRVRVDRVGVRRARSPPSQDNPTPENAPFPVQTSIYAASKVAAEGLLSSYAQPSPAPGFRAWIFRFVSILGPRYTHGHVYDFWHRAEGRSVAPRRSSATGSSRRATCTCTTA